MTLNPETVSNLFEKEMARFKDAQATDALRRLAIPARLEERPWDYGEPGQTFPCWIVAEDPESWTSLAYCEHGFGPQCPWGLLHMADPSAVRPQSMGMDSSWFRTLEEAFLDSYAGGDFRRPTGARSHFLAQRELALLLRREGYSKVADKFERLLAMNAGATASDLFAELENETLEFQAKRVAPSARLGEFLKQNLAAVKKVWPKTGA